MTTTPKFAKEHGQYVNANGSGTYAVLASPGYPDLLVQPAGRNGEGYNVTRRGDADVIAHFRTQREAKVYAVGAWKVDQA